jgi:transposase
VRKISLSEAIEELSKKYFGLGPVDFFEAARGNNPHKEIIPIYLGFYLTDVASITYEYENDTNTELAKLRDEVKHLRHLLNKNPANSHKPPSSEKNKKIKNSREKTDKPIGGQIGHVGHSHELHDCPDSVHRYDIQKCIECGTRLNKTPEHEVVRKQTVDIREGKMHVTEYQTVIKFCPNCDRWNRGEEPKELQKSRVIFGSNLKAVAVYFMVQHLLPFWRTQAILWDIFGISISQGSLCRFVQDFGDHLSDWESLAKQQLIHSKLNHVDETGIRCEKRSDWAHVVSNDSITLIFHHESRGKEAIDEIGVLPEFKGHLVHDAFSAYWNYGKTHSLCNSHILRELKSLYEDDKQQWALNMSELLKASLHDVHEGKYKSTVWKQSLKKEFTSILKKGFVENGFPQEWKGRPPDGFKEEWDGRKMKKIPIFRRRKHTVAMNLLNRLRDYEREVLSFAMKPGIPFSNNQAERDFRMLKLKEKISGCFRSKEMAKMFLRVKSYLSTLGKQGQPLLENLVLIDICR